MEPTDQDIIDYLLGDMPEPAQVRLEENLFADDDFFQRLSVLENKLIDLYVLNRLSDPERKMFEQKYLVSPRRRRAVASSTQFIDLLNSYSRRQTSKQGKSWWSWLRSFFTANSLMIQMSTSSLLILISAAFIWVLVDRARLRSRSEAAEQAQRQASIREQEERAALEREREELKRKQAEQQINEESLRQRQQELQAREARLRSNQSGRVVQPSFATFVLSQTLRSSGAPRELVISAQDKFVHLVAYLSDEPAERYRASIQRVSGEEVWRTTLPKASGDPPQVKLVVPAAVFKERDYFVKLEGFTRNGQPMAPIEYALTVRKEASRTRR